MALSPGARAVDAVAPLEPLSASLGLDFWGVPLACLALTLGYIAWMVVAERREGETDNRVDAP